jgi:hypothetical protein
VQKLVKPAAASTLSGRIVVDPSYILASKLGNLITNDGGGLITNDGGGLITNDGASIVASGGGNVVAQGAGNVAVGGQIVAQGAGNVIVPGAAGGQIVATGGGNVLPAGIVAQGAGNIVSQGAGNYRLAATSDVPPLPAAGFPLSVVSLDTQRYLPLGKDASGQDVYTIYTNAKGEYEVYLPADQQANILVVTAVPNARDERLLYSLVAPPPATKPQATLDNDSNLASLYVRQAFTERLKQILVGQSLDEVTALIRDGCYNDSSETTSRAAYAITTQIFNAARRHHLPPRAPDGSYPPLVNDLAQRMVDAAIASLDLDKVQISGAFSAYWPYPDEPALPALAQTLASLRLRAADFRHGTGGFDLFQHDFKFLDADRCVRPTRMTEADVREDADLGRYLVEHFMTRNVRNNIVNTGTLLKDLGRDYYEPGNPMPTFFTTGDHPTQHRRLETASYALVAALGGRTPEMLALLDAYCKDHGQPDDPGVPTPEPPYVQPTHCPEPTPTPDCTRVSGPLPL